MVYQNYHWDCKEDECKALTAYVRIDSKWTRIGIFGSECKKFEPLDLQKEERERLQKEKLDLIKSELRQTKQENRERRKTIENEFNANTSFFKQQTRTHQSDSK